MMFPSQARVLGIHTLSDTSTTQFMPCQARKKLGVWPGGRPIHLVWPLESNSEVWCSNLGSDAIWGPALAGVNLRI